MAKEPKFASGAERFIETTLALIAEEGGSQNVNLRQVSRRLGCAHTNLYNYFASYEDLLWAAFRRAICIYGDFLVRGLDDNLAPGEYLRRVVSNLAAFPVEQPGLFRFVGSDPINPDRIPDDILDAVGAMKTWLFEVMRTVYGGDADPEDAASVSNIVLAYIDGETLNLINGRMVRGEDIHSRIVANSIRLVEALTGAAPAATGSPSHPYPAMDLSALKKGA